MGSPAKRTQKKNRRRASAPAKGQPPFSSVLRLTLACAALIFLILIAYGNSLGNGFVWDDHQQILLNPALKPGAPLTRLFTADVRFGPTSFSLQTSAYRPLQALTYRLLFASFGAHPTAFHICNIVFAIAGVLAAFAVFWLLTHKLDVAFPAAALFAVHPIHTESIDWIASLPELGCSLFLLLAFALFLAGHDAHDEFEHSTSRHWLIASLSYLFYATALCWKETAVVFPILIVLYVLLAARLVGSRSVAALRQSAPFWVILAAYLGMRLYVLGTLSAGPRNWALTPIQYVISVLHLMWSYWAKLALPLQLNAYYLFRPIRSVADPRAIAAILLSLCAGAALIFLLRRISPVGRTSLGIFAALWVFLTLLPAMDLNALGRNPFSERYLYLPSAGFCLLVILAVARLIERIPANLRRTIGSLLLFLVLAGFTWETIARNPVWRDDATLFSETVRSSPDAPFIRYMVATNESADPTQSAAAEQNYLHAIALAKQQLPPDRLDAVMAYQGLAWIYADRSNFQQALQTLAEARQIAPIDADTTGEEGLILARAGRGKEAEPLLERSLITQVNNENILSALGLIARDDQHDLNKAADLFSRVLAIHTEDDDFAASQHNNLGAVYGDLGDFAQAIAQFRRATQIVPTDPQYHVNLASALAAQNRFDEARSEAQLALHLAPDNSAAREILERLASSN
jgi:tetratricopeptide (TPR) repeat protein